MPTGSSIPAPSTRDVFAAWSKSWSHVIEESLMEKLMSEQRRMIEGFEVIEHVDEKQIADLRKRVDVDVPLSLHWTWEYGSEVEELRQLYERGKRGQWNAETDIDWSTPFPRDEWFLPRENSSLLAGVLQIMGADDDTCREAAWDEFAHT